MLHRPFNGSLEGFGVYLISPRGKRWFVQSFRKDELVFKFGGNSTVRDFEWKFVQHCHQANQLDPTRFNWTCTYICVSHHIKCFIHTRVFLLPFSSTGFSGWNTFIWEEWPRETPRDRSCVRCWQETSLPACLMNINYVMFRLLSWLAESQRSSQINESYSAEVLLMNIN